MLEVPPRLHRFVRFFLRTSFRFASGPLQALSGGDLVGVALPLGSQRP